MPKISAPSIAEHVRQQEEAILTAAAALFAERGVAGTDLADIARAVGLARSSLYRYFPDKDHILLRWFERELDPFIERSNTILDGEGAVDDRIHAWTDFQLDFVTHPDHDLAPKLMQEIGAVSPEVRRSLAEGHARLYRTLGSVVAASLAEHGGADRNPIVVSMLIGGIIEMAGRSLLQPGPMAPPVEDVRAEAHRAIDGILRGPA